MSSVLEKKSQAIVEYKHIEKILENRIERFRQKKKRNRETSFANQEACGKTLSSGVKESDLQCGANW